MTIGIEYIYDNETGQTIVIDNRIFSRCVEKQLETIRGYAKQVILESAPEHKQRNAALGLLSEQETQYLKETIQNIRNISNQKEQEIFSVVWDGTEETRAAACDAVQAVRWE